MKEQKLIKLRRTDGQYANFFYTPNSIDSLDSFLRDGWIVIEMEIDKENQSGWVLLERQI